MSYHAQYTGDSGASTRKIARYEKLGHRGHLDWAPGGNFNLPYVIKRAMM